MWVIIARNRSVLDEWYCISEESHCLRCPSMVDSTDFTPQQLQKQHETWCVFSLYLACQVLCKNICMSHVVLSGYITWLGTCVMCSEGVWRKCSEGSHWEDLGRGGWILPNSMEQSPSWEASSYSTIQEIPAFYGTWWFIKMFRRFNHFFPFWGRWISSMPSPPVSVRSILILPCYLHLDLPMISFF